MDSGGKTYRVVRSHRPDSTEEFALEKGDTLQFERRKTKWDGWLWCSKPDGRSGWVPESWVRVEGDVCIMERDYNALELAVEPDELLEGILTESGWLLAVSASGDTGWVPLECVDIHPL